jgi:hypothetical protein
MLHAGVLGSERQQHRGCRDHPERIFVIRPPNSSDDRELSADETSSEGNDGPWSSFFVRVGTPEQTVRVLVSTASPETLVVLSEYGCSTSVFATVPDKCAVSRGVLFDPNQSSTWHDVGTYGINQDGVGLEANLAYSQRAAFSFETLAVGLTGPGLRNQTVAGIATPEPFYLYGISCKPPASLSLFPS